LETYHKATEHHLPYGITQCYWPLDTDERHLTLTRAREIST